jgi:protease I
MEKRIAILATDGFEESELKSPKEAMEKEGFQTEIVSIKPDKIKAWDAGIWSVDFKLVF